MILRVQKYGQYFSWGILSPAPVYAPQLGSTEPIKLHWGASATTIPMQRNLLNNQKKPIINIYYDVDNPQRYAKYRKIGTKELICVLSFIQNAHNNNKKSTEMGKIYNR